MKRIALVLSLPLAACTAAQLQTASMDLATAQAYADSACAQYSAIATGVNLTPIGATPQAQTIELYGTAACLGEKGTSIIVQKMLSDPTTQAWIVNLGTQLKAIRLPAARHGYVASLRLTGAIRTR